MRASAARPQRLQQMQTLLVLPRSPHEPRPKMATSATRGCVGEELLARSWALASYLVNLVRPSFAPQCRGSP